MERPTTRILADEFLKHDRSVQDSAIELVLLRVAAEFECVKPFWNSQKHSQL